MAEEDTGQEKTLDPTPQRLEKARKDGDVPQSRDLAAVAGYLGLLLAMAVSGGTIAFGFAEPLSAFLASPRTMSGKLLAPGGPELAMLLLSDAFFALAPIFVIPAIAVIVVLVAQRAIVLAPSKIEPKLSRINPIKNAAQKFGPTGLVEFAKSVVKLLAIGAILIAVFLSEHDGVAALVQLDARALPGLLMQEGMLMLGAATVVAGAIAALDVLWQQYDHKRKLRMSPQEVKEEAKQSDGDPHMKHKRRVKGREIAMNQMLAEVPKADVVIVNPTHYAVALKWARTPGSAPVCVAKGVDEIAFKIREIAKEHDIPIHSDPPTARALHATVELEDEVHPDHYQAVAVAIRFADAIRAKARARQGSRPGARPGGGA